VQISRLQGDYNFDDSVDARDYVLWRNAFGTSVPKHSSTDGNGDAEVNGTDYTIWRGNFGASFPGAGAGAAVTGTHLRDNNTVSSSSGPESSVAAARDEVLAGFSTASGSANSTTTRVTRSRLQLNSPPSDGILLCAVINEKQKYTADKTDASIDGNRVDHTNAIDESFSDLDCKLSSAI
jgi:hypothetical protein